MSVRRCDGGRGDRDGSGMLGRRLMLVRRRCECDLSDYEITAGQNGDTLVSALFRDLTGDTLRSKKIFRPPDQSNRRSTYDANMLNV